MQNYWPINQNFSFYFGHGKTSHIKASEFIDAKNVFLVKLGIIWKVNCIDPFYLSHANQRLKGQDLILILIYWKNVKEDIWPYIKDESSILFK